MLLCAIIGVAPSNPPRIVGTAGYIDANGYLWALVQAPNDPPGRCDAANLGSIPEIKDLLNRLADEIKATDQERIELFETLKKWIRRDERAYASPELDNLGDTDDRTRKP